MRLVSASNEDRVPAGWFPDCPLIRLFDFTLDQVKALSAIVQELAERAGTSIAIHALPGIVAIDGITLTFASSGNAGLLFVRRTSGLCV